ncbi:MAG: FlgD immunoglobulin-like domain containing protein [Candidatus Eisenbacteria bacterium]
MRHSLLLLSMFMLATTAQLSEAALPASRECSSATRITPIEGRPNEFRLDSPHGELLARWAQVRPSAAVRTGAIVTIFARAFHFDADNDVVATERDTVIVSPGTTVRFQLASGIHTVTNGFDSGDPSAASAFSVLLDEAHPTFDTTLTTPTQFDYFCFFHEPVMGGTIIVRQNTGVPGEPNGGRVSFSRSPSPNPARGVVGFAIALPRATSVRLEVLDLSGRRLRTLYAGELGGGEHAFRWDGRSERAGGVASGRYQIRLIADGVTLTRGVSVLR